MRDLDKTIETMKPIPTVYDLTASQVVALFELSKKDVFEAFIKLYRYAFELGRREERNRRKRNKKQ